LSGVVVNVDSAESKLSEFTENILFVFDTVFDNVEVGIDLFGVAK
jgi:hypothetical protein